MIHGLIAVDKEKGLSSHDVVDAIRKIFKIKKAGHFGALDPLATGLLLIALGNATKFFSFYLKKEKQYAGTIEFGYGTTTYDSEGEPLGEKKEINLGNVDVAALLAAFSGPQTQIPPIYSAKKFKGRPLYYYARHPQSDRMGVVLRPVQVEIYHLEGKAVGPATLQFRALTSSGTYMRTLAHDIGQRLNVGAYLKELRRERIGEFSLDSAFTLEEIRHSAAAGDLRKVIIPIESLLPEFPKIIVSPAGCRDVGNGLPLQPENILKLFPAASNDNFRLFDEEGKFLAIARKNASRIGFKPYIVFPD